MQNMCTNLSRWLAQFRIFLSSLEGSSHHKSHWENFVTSFLPSEPIDAEHVRLAIQTIKNILQGESVCINEYPPLFSITQQRDSSGVTGQTFSDQLSSAADQFNLCADNIGIYRHPLRFEGHAAGGLRERIVARFLSNCNEIFFIVKLGTCTCLTVLTVMILSDPVCY